MPQAGFGFGAALGASHRDVAVGSEAAVAPLENLDGKAGESGKFQVSFRFGMPGPTRIAVDFGLGGSRMKDVALFPDDQTFKMAARNNLSRRSFIQLATVGGASWALLDPKEAGANPVVALLGALADFALAVGSAVIADQIAQYLEGLDQPEFIGRIQETNEDLARIGFKDHRWSKVRGDSNSPSRIYYPVVYERCTCLHFAAPFFNVGCGCVPITYIEGCHIIGLSLAAQEFAQVSRQTACDVFFPRKGIQQSQGDRIQGYSKSLIYESDRATVLADFKPKGDGAGTVIIKAQRHGDGRLIYDSVADIEYA